LDFAKLNEIKQWMRANGVTSLKTGDIEITLGAEPPPLQPIPLEPPSQEDLERARKRWEEQRERLLFMASEGDSFEYEH
jgi:hypothetical protein